MRRPPVFWGYGDNDPNLTHGRTTAIRPWLNAHAKVVEVRSPGLGHDIDDYLMERLSTFIDDVTPDSHPC